MKNIILLFTINVTFLFVGCQAKEEAPMKTLSVQEAKEIARLNPKKDTTYIDSTGHVWYVYVKPSGMVVILSEKDTTEGSIR